MEGLGVLGRARSDPPPEEIALSPLAMLFDRPPPVPAAAETGVAELRSALADCRGEDGKERPVPVQIERIRRFLEPILHRRYASPSSRIRDIEQLERMASRAGSRGRFLADLTLDPPVSTGDLAGPPLRDEDYVVLSTIHSAKGCEWDVVHVIHAADGVIPSDLATGNAEEIEEERRLLYVAMTRARNALHVYFPLRYYHRGKPVVDAHSYAQLTRFIPPTIRRLFQEEGATANVPADLPSVPMPAGRAGGVDGFLRSLWDE
jgi:DNA helicase II / ATP-dependent DNA helicase PcrA